MDRRRGRALDAARGNLRGRGYSRGRGDGHSSTLAKRPADDPGYNVIGMAAKKAALENNTSHSFNICLPSLLDELYIGYNTSGEAMAIHQGTNLWDVMILDSGASGSIVGRKDLFVEYTEMNGATANGIGGAKVTPIGKGTIELNCQLPDSKTRRLRICNVQYAPNIGVNLISLNEMWPYIDDIRKTATTLRFSQGGYVFQATIKGGLLILDTVSS
jgi:hypothetical protein